MKITAFLMAGVLAAATSAQPSDVQLRVRDAIKDDSTLLQRYCDSPGQACYQVKKAVDEAGPHLTYPDIHNTTEWADCYKDGNTCQIAKRSAEALASAAAEAYAKANASPEPYWKVCHFAGQPCLKTKRDPYWKVCHFAGQPCLKAREPEPQIKHQSRSARFCDSTGCAKMKRSALPAPAPEASLDARYWKVCHFAGQPCLKIRSATAAIDKNLFGRDALFGGKPGKKNHDTKARFCDFASTPCMRARSAEEGDALTTVESDSLAALDEECNKPGAPCDIARRAAQDLGVAAAQAHEQAGL